MTYLPIPLGFLLATLFAIGITNVPDAADIVEMMR